MPSSHQSVQKPSTATINTFMWSDVTKTSNHSRGVIHLSEYKLCRCILHLHDVDADGLTLAQRSSSHAGRRRYGPRTAFGGSDCRSTMNKCGLPWQWFRELYGAVAHAGALTLTAAHVTQDENAADSAHVKADGTRTVKCGLSCSIWVDLATSESSLSFSSPILQVLIRILVAVAPSPWQAGSSSSCSRSRTH